MALSRWYASRAVGRSSRFLAPQGVDQVVEIGVYLGMRLAGKRRVQDGPDRVHVVAGIRRVAGAIAFSGVTASNRAASADRRARQRS